jgi:nitrogen fixation protein NifB
MSLQNHPCFNPLAGVSHGRVHLPVAGKCNIQCNYCNRLYDCVNESRPGVTSAVLSPKQALYYLDNVLPLLDCKVSVVGIAGPGDPMNDPAATIETLKLVHDKYPEMVTCLASNGLNLADHAKELAEVGVGHVTVTINAIDPEITSKIIAWARFGSKVYRGIDAGKILVERQIAAVKELKKYGIVVKINCIVIPGINDMHVPEVSKFMKELGADVMNILPLRPVNDTQFADITPPHHDLMQKVRWEASQNMTVVHHCAMCRADAAGRLGHDNSAIVHKLLQSTAARPLDPYEDRPFIAVASREGMLINEHLGQSRQFYIYDLSDASFQVKEIRSAPDAGAGNDRWKSLAETLKDCKTLLVSQAGEPPKAVLAETGLQVIITEGLIDQALSLLQRGISPLPVANIKSCTGGEGRNPCC